MGKKRRSENRQGTKKIRLKALPDSAKGQWVAPRKIYGFTGLTTFGTGLLREAVRDYMKALARGSGICVSFKTKKTT